jgi:predicted nuclease of predicted toxin-antitoxin system
MNFVVDQNLPAWLAGWLRDTGHDAVHLREIGMQAAMDDEVAALVRARSAVLITKDGDFARPPGPGAPVVWVRIGNATHGRLVAVWADVWADVVLALENGETLIEVRAP